MLLLNKKLLLGAAAGALATAISAQAQYQVTHPDGIAASPKVRQMLNERKVVVPVSSRQPLAPVSYRAVGPDGIVASPRVRQMLNERTVLATSAMASSTQVASAGYRPTGTDGITASPRLRQQLSERPIVFQVAPVK